jgi:cephalosporin-C deacetylase-like acetyl esterase
MNSGGWPKAHSSRCQRVKVYSQAMLDSDSRNLATQVITHKFQFGECTVKRRNFLLQAGTLPLALSVAPWPYTVQALPKNTPPVPSYEKEYPDMLLNYLGGKLNALSRHWDQQREKILAPAQLERRNQFVRGKFREMLQGFPPRVPLQARTVRSFDREGYRVENVMFQSRPDFWVTGNLYIPSQRKGPSPGIISPCGHYTLGRVNTELQCAYINLVQNGFVVLAYDPIGQGERRYYWNPETKVAEVSGDPIFEHSMPGQLLLLMGENLTQYRVWDGMRAIDYLLTRSEVDSQRIGCTGHSGGGTLTLFITALDDRVKCAVLNEGGCAQRWPLQISAGSRIGPSDVEQNIFPSAIYGIDEEDLRVAIAPRPQLLTIEDYYPEFLQSRERVSARYRQLGVPDKFATADATDPHAWTMKLRLATTDWFCRWFYEHPGPTSESEFKVETPQQLYCTSNGSLRYSQQGENIFSLLKTKAAQLPPQRHIPSTTTARDQTRQEILSQIGKSARLDAPQTALGVRKLVTTERKGYRIEKLQFLSEPGIYIPAWVFIPKMLTPNHAAILYVDEMGKEAQGLEFGLLEGLALKGNLVVAIDVRGIGGTEPPHDPWLHAGGEFGHLFNVETAMSYMAWFMDESLFAMRVRDVIRGVDYTLSRPEVKRQSVRVVWKGMGALWTLFAAAHDLRIQSAICEGGLVSYRSLTDHDRYVHGANVFIRDVLLHYDLPEVAACVASRNLVLLSPLDAMGIPVDLAKAKEIYQWTKDAYAAANAQERFKIIQRDSEQEVVEEYLALLQD